MDTIEESPFIVISGPPERGKWERLSQARSILTKRQFQRIKKQQPPPNTAGISKRRYPNGETKRHDLDEQSRAVASKGNVARNAQLSRQEKPPLLPAINLSLEPVILASYTSRRLHECKFGELVPIHRDRLIWLYILTYCSSRNPSPRPMPESICEIYRSMVHF